MEELESLQLAANNAVEVLNVQGDLLEDRLWDVSVCVREIALHGVRHGAAFTLMMAQVNSVHEL